VSIVATHLALNRLQLARVGVDESPDARHHLLYHPHPFPLPLVHWGNNTHPLVATGRHPDVVLRGLQSVPLSTQIDSKLIQDVGHYTGDKALKYTQITTLKYAQFKRGT
jgi:hypothetical protein